MISPSFSIKEFLDAMVGKDWEGIITAADYECGVAEQRSRGKRGKEAKEMGSMRYAASLKSFLFFIRFGVKPFGVSDREFAMYLPVCEALVQRGDFKPSVLEMFK